MHKIYLLLISLFFLPPWLLQAQVTFVNPSATGTGDGDSWDNAYTDLQTAIQNTSSGELWVAAGTYYPTTGTDRTLSFSLKNDLVLYGGFLGGETQLSQRDLITNHTILSGEIGDLASASDNSYHVVLADNVNSTAVLDGFQIKHGMANGNGSDRNGGGMLYLGNNKDASPMVRNCYFSKNKAAGSGGAISMDLYHFSYTQLNISIDRCTFENNSASFSGGALAVVADISTSLVLEVKNSSFNNNHSDYAAGAIYAYEGSSAPQIIRFSNCLITNNQSSQGAGAEIYGSYNITFEHTTFYNNEATNSNHILYTNAGTIANFNNCVLWGSQSGTYIPYSPSILVRNSVLKGGMASGSNIWDMDPKLVDPASGDYAIADCSPIINLGDEDLVPGGLPTDFIGNTRVVGGRPDLGAYEHQGGPTDFEYAATGSLVLEDYCPNGYWTHYSASADPTKLLFSIEHFPDAPGANTNFFSAGPSLDVTANSSSSTDFVNGIYKSENLLNLEAIFAMGRSWNVNITEGSLNGFVNVRFYYKPDELAAIEQAADDWILANGGSLSKATYWVKSVDEPYNPLVQLLPSGLFAGIEIEGNPGMTSDNINYVQFDGISSFSGGTAVVRVSDNNTSLPVELVSFTAVREEESRVNLAWTFSYESRNAGFEIERRLANETDFRSLGYVESQGPTGLPRSYQFSDSNDHNVWSYYRIKIIDTEGRFDYSDVRVVKNRQRLGEISLFPNPAHHSVQIVLPNDSGQKDIQVTLTNTLQQLVLQTATKAGADNNILLENLEELAAGIYFLTVRVNGLSYTERLLIN